MPVTAVTTVHPRAVVDPRSAASTTVTSDKAAEQTDLKADEDKGAEEYLFHGFHGWLAGLGLFTYSTTPTVPPVGSAMRAKRLPDAES